MDQSRIKLINKAFKEINKEILYNTEIGNPWAYIKIFEEESSIIDDLRDRILKQYSHMEIVVEIKRDPVSKIPTMITVKWDEFD